MSNETPARMALEKVHETVLTAKLFLVQIQQAIAAVQPGTIGFFQLDRVIVLVSHDTTPEQLYRNILSVLSDQDVIGVVGPKDEITTIPAQGMGLVEKPFRKETGLYYFLYDCRALAKSHNQVVFFHNMGYVFLFSPDSNHLDVLIDGLLAIEGLLPGYVVGPHAAILEESVAEARNTLAAPIRAEFEARKAEHDAEIAARQAKLDAALEGTPEAEFAEDKLIAAINTIAAETNEACAVEVATAVKPMMRLLQRHVNQDQAISSDQLVEAFTLTEINLAGSSRRMRSIHILDCIIASWKYAHLLPR